MNHSLDDLEAKQLKQIRSHLQHELDTTYSTKSIKKGFRLSPLQISQISFEVDELTATIKDKKQAFQIRMVMPFFEESGYSFTSCSCQEMSIDLEETRCHHMWLAQSQFLKSVEIQLDSLEVFSTIWEQMASHLDPLIESIKQAADDQNYKETVFWELDFNFNFSTILVTVNESGNWVHQKKLTFSEFMKDKRYWQNSSYKGIAARIGQQLLKSKGSDFCELTYEILGELADARLEAIDEHQKPLTIHRAKLSISFKLEKAGLSWLFNEFDAKNDAIKIYQQGILIYKKSKNLVFLLDFPYEGLFDFCNFLIINLNKVIEPRHVNSILCSLSKLQLQLPLNFSSRSFKISEGTSSQYTYLRITPLSACGVIIECFKCPLGSYTKNQIYVQPGVGPSNLWDLDDYKSVKYVQRDLSQEITKTQALTSSLNLKIHSRLSPYCYEIKDDLAAIELIDHLNNLEDKSQIIVEWPPGIEKKNYEIVEPSEEQKITLEVSEKNDWFFLKGGIQINGEKVSVASILKSMASKQNFLKLQHGKWLKISKCLKDRLKALDSFYDSRIYEKLPILRPTPSTLNKWEKINQHPFFSTISTPDWDQRIGNINKYESTHLQLPKNFVGNLRPYQKTGFEWLAKLSNWGMGGILADDMGLGKTIQTICFLLHRSEKGASLIVCPSSVTENWIKELIRFAPSLNAYDLRKDRNISNKLLPNSLIICSYGLLLSNSKLLGEYDWNVIVLDEAQICKNPSSKTYKAAKSLKSEISLALSGTPIENNLQDLWAIFSLVNPSLLGPWQQFKDEWIKETANKTASNQKLGEIINPFLLRRLKQDYLSELPPKTEKFLQLNLNQDERKLYDRIRAEAIALLTESKEKSNEEDSTKEFNGVRIKLLSYITRLRQLCSHPVLIEADWPNQSSKMEIFGEKALYLLEAGHKVLVFSQFPSFLKLLQSSIQEHGARCLYLDGSTPSTERSKNIDQFQNDEADFFFISLKAGGTGINLTKADYVFHMDPWWNPAVQAQATDRAYRMGQKNPVTIYRFICKHTVEETMTGLHKRKTELATEVLSDQDQDSKRFNEDYFLELLGNKLEKPPNFNGHSFS